MTKPKELKNFKAESYAGWLEWRKKYFVGKGKKNMKAAVVGVGRMGTAICYAMSKLGHYVVGLDANEGAVENFRKHINADAGAFYACGERDYKEILGQFENPDIVISSLPYHQNEPLAEFCIDNGIRYCDLGGRVDVSKSINSYAEQHAEKPVMTDLGLAPGWVNIVAEWGYKEIRCVPDSIKMMVGGLPVTPVNPPLDYIVTWSVEGLINEYRDKCEALQEGEIVSVDGMDGCEPVKMSWIGRKLEAFYTSGGTSHTIHDMKSRGVKNCSYKTMRYVGHCDAVKFLIRNWGLTEDCLLQIFEKGCENSDEQGDMVVMQVEVSKGTLRWKKEILVHDDKNKNFTAMQRATAFPISAVASMMSEGLFDCRDGLPLALSYKDITIDKLNEKLEKLGLIYLQT